MTTLTRRRAGGVVLAAMATLVASAIYYTVFGTVYQRLGSVVHEHYPLGLYLLHVGDALMTTLIMALILGRKAA